MERFMVSTTAPIQHLSWVAVERERGRVVSFSGGRLWDTLIVVVEGSLLYQPCGKRACDGFTAQKGDCVFFPRGAKNICTYLEDRNRIISVQMQAAEQTAFFHNRPKLYPNAAADGEVNKVITSVLSCEDIEPQARSLFLTSQFYLLLYHLKRSFLNGAEWEQNQRDYQRLKPAIDHLTLHFYENRKAAEYAAMVHMCESGFRKLFLKCMGQSPIAYRNAVRMQKANDMLSSGEFSVTQAAQAVGIENLSFFCREYKKFFGTCANRRSGG